jgi:ubiquinone biosynthesis protein
VPFPFPFPLRHRIAEIVRVRRITEVLVRNGLGFMVEQLALDRFLPHIWRRQAGRADRAVSRLTVPERLRRTLEELGATYVKLGQLLSGRGDLLPPDYISELSKLLDAAPPVPIDDIRAVIDEELGAPVDDLFATFDEAPIASASIGQVHRATLPDGTVVAVKVQRPGIEAVVEADLRLLLGQVRFLGRRSGIVRDYNLVAVAEELARSLREELDYKIEGRNAERLRTNLRNDPRVVIPCIHWSLTSRRVITLDYLDGIKLSEPERLRQVGVNLGAAVRLGVEIYLKQIFEHGFYHADPHPANIMVITDAGPVASTVACSRIGLVDFGTAGYLTPGQKELLSDMLLQLLDQDAGGVARTVLRMGATRGRPSVDAMERDLQRLLIRYWGVALEQISIGEMLSEIFKTAYQYRVYLPGDLTLLGKTILTLEGTARSLDPEFVLADAVRPFAEQLVRERLSPLTTGRRVVRTFRQAVDFAQAFPRRLDDFWDQLEEGEFTVGIDLRHLNVLISRLNSMVNRLAFALVVAALIVGSALILLGGKDSWQLPLLGIGIPVAQIVFLVAFGAGLWLIISMIRSRGL